MSAFCGNVYTWHYDVDRCWWPRVRALRAQNGLRITAQTCVRSINAALCSGSLKHMMEFLQVTITIGAQTVVRSI